MSEEKAKILYRLEALTKEYETLVEDLEQSTRNIRGRPLLTGTRKQALENRFYDLRTRCVELLVLMSSEGRIVDDALEYVRVAEMTEFNLQSVIRALKELRSDYQAGLLERRPDLGQETKKQQQMRLLRDISDEVQALHPPYLDEEVDRLEKRAIMVVRHIFGESSTQAKELNDIFYPSFSVGYLFDDPESRLNRHIAKWNDRRLRLLNSIEIMLEELELSGGKFEVQVANPSPVALGDSSTARHRWLDEPKAMIIAAVIGVIGVILASIIGVLLTQVMNLNSLIKDAIVLTHTPRPTLTVTVVHTDTPVFTLTPGPVIALTSVPERDDNVQVQ